MVLEVGHIALVDLVVVLAVGLLEDEKQWFICSVLQ